MTTLGHCHCGQTRWKFENRIMWACFCHCEDCRRNCSAPFVAWLAISKKDFRWLGLCPKTRESSAGVYRHFCQDCGSPMGFEAKHYPGMMHLYAASMENPSDFKPTFHVNYHRKLSWINIDDDLPKYESNVLDIPQM